MAVLDCFDINGRSALVTGAASGIGLAYAEAERASIAAKLGLAECRDGDVESIRDLHGLLHEYEVDMTLWFRGLADLDIDAPSLRPLEAAFYDPAKRAAGEGAFNDWLARHASRLRDDGLSPARRRDCMHAANPKYVLRNWLAQEVIERAAKGDVGGIDELMEVLRTPYQDQPGCERFSARRPEWAVDRAGCSMLSCSS